MVFINLRLVDFCFNLKFEFEIKVMLGHPGSLVFYPNLLNHTICLYSRILFSVVWLQFALNGTHRLSE